MKDVMQDLWFDTACCLIGGIWRPGGGRATLAIEDPAQLEIRDVGKRPTEARADAAVLAHDLKFRGGGVRGADLPFGGTGLPGHGPKKGFEAPYGFSTLETIAPRHG